MVAKISSGASIYGAVSYNQEKLDAKQARILGGNKMIENIIGKEGLVFGQTLRSFQPYLLANKRTQKPVMHISLNPSPEDQLSDEKFIQIGHDYMQAMGYKDQPYILYLHEDIERKHMHIVTVRVDEYGKKLKDSFENLTSMNICRDLELKYGLKQISNKQDEEIGQQLNKVDYSQGDIKKQIANTVENVSKNYQFQTFGEYNALLSYFHVQAKHIRGEEKGNLYNGVIYSATNEAGEAIGNPIKSSRIGKSTGFDSLTKLMAKTSEASKKTPNSYRGKLLIAKAMQISSSKEEFTQKLKTQNIDVVFRSNETSRIYGVTFIDHKEKIVYNGSRLGKEFSANVFQALFNEGQNQNNTSSQTPIPSQSSPVQQMSSTDMAQNLDFALPEYHSTTDAYQKHASLDDIFGTFSSAGTGVNSEEEDFIRRMKRKKKKGRRRNL